MHRRGSLLLQGKAASRLAVGLRDLPLLRLALLLLPVGLKFSHVTVYLMEIMQGFSPVVRSNKEERQVLLYKTKLQQSTVYLYGRGCPRPAAARPLSPPHAIVSSPTHSKSPITVTAQTT